MVRLVNARDSYQEYLNGSWGRIKSCSYTMVGREGGTLFSKRGCMAGRERMIQRKGHRLTMIFRLFRQSMVYSCLRSGPKFNKTLPPVHPKKCKHDGGLSFCSSRVLWNWEILLCDCFRWIKHSCSSSLVSILQRFVEAPPCHNPHRRRAGRNNNIPIQCATERGIPSFKCYYDK